ncbi:hypothetical protein TNCT_714591, partial [Trichonephila clavata]
LLFFVFQSFVVFPLISTLNCSSSVTLTVLS